MKKDKLSLPYGWKMRMALLVSIATITTSMSVYAAQAEKSTTENKKMPTLSYRVRQESEEDADGNLLLSATFRKPVIENPSAEDAAEYINEQLSDQQLDFVKRCGILLANQTEEEVEDGGCVLDEIFHARRFDDQVASFRIETTGYTGGEKGSYETKAVNYDMTTGERLTMEDLSEEPEELYDACMEEILLQCAELSKSHNLVQDRALEYAVRKLVKRDYFLFTPAGLNFTTTPGMISTAGEADQVYSFTVPYELLSSLKADYAYDGPICMEQQKGMPLKADLDGDGEMESILYDYDFDIEAGDDVISLQVDGTDYSDLLRNNNLYVGGGYPGYFQVVDVDTSDDAKEILIPDGSKGMSHFYAYGEGSLKYIGTVPGLPEPTGLSLAGDGVVRSQKTASLAEDYQIPVVYELNDKLILEEIPSEWYDLTAEDGYTLQGHSFILEEDSEVYPEADPKSEKFTLAAGSKCYYVATDDANWLEGRTKDGTVFYQYSK